MNTSPQKGHILMVILLTKKFRLFGPTYLNQVLEMVQTG